jgi:4-hydroxybenzoate polyprenyltransferase
VPPIRLKRLLWINNLTQATARGILGVFTAWSVYSTVTKEALAMSLVLFSFILWSQTSKDIPDLPGDKMYGIKTLPVAYGLERTKKIMTCMAPIPFIATIAFVWMGWLPASSLLTLLLLPLALYIPRGTTQTDRAENTYGWLCFYGVMVSFLLLFMLTV